MGTLSKPKTLEKMTPAQDPKQGNNDKYEKYKNENIQQLIILEGFMQNGLQHRNQNISLRIKSCVKIDV